jgi:hypothetical protein
MVRSQAVPLLATAVAQAAGLRLAELTGVDIDTPHGLAKVTQTLEPGHRPYSAPSWVRSRQDEGFGGDTPAETLPRFARSAHAMRWCASGPRARSSCVAGS